MKKFERIIGVPGLSNLGVVKEGAIYRSAQPQLFEALPQYLGIKSVLCLREHSEQEVAESAGLKYFSFRINVFSKVDPDELNLIVSVLSDPINQPILFHCLQGQDRTGMVCAAYRLAIDKWTLEEALEEMNSYGAFNLWWMMKNNIEAYAAVLRPVGG